MAKNSESNPLFRLESIYSSQDPLQGSTGRLLISLIREFENAWNKGTPSGFQDDGLSASEFNVIGTIRAGQTQISDIARRMGVTKQAISKSVINLKRRGLIDFLKNAADGRSKVLSLTQKGDKLMEQALNKAREIELMYISALGGDAHSKMIDSLQRLIDTHRA